MRSSMLILVPDYCKENESKGLCRICGKSRPFNKRMKKYCSDTCSWEYQKFFISWNEMRSRILLRDNYTCKLCSLKTGAALLDVDHILPIYKGGKQWDESNLQTLCKPCHKKKTASDVKHRIKGAAAWENTLYPFLPSCPHESQI